MRAATYERWLERLSFNSIGCDEALMSVWRNQMERISRYSNSQQICIQKSNPPIWSFGTRTRVRVGGPRYWTAAIDPPSQSRYAEHRKDHCEDFCRNVASIIAGASLTMK